MTEVKSSLDKFNSKLYTAEHRIPELEDKSEDY